MDDQNDGRNDNPKDDDCWRNEFECKSQYPTFVTFLMMIFLRKMKLLPN